jgi:hypothetical protein
MPEEIRAWIDWSRGFVVVEGAQQVHLDWDQAIAYGVVIRRLGEDLRDATLPDRTLSVTHGKTG